MQQTKKLRIFLDPSSTELSNERILLFDYLMYSVGPIFQQDGIVIQVYKDFYLINTTNPHQREIDKVLRECDVSIFMFKSMASDMAIHEFDVARQLQKSKSHEIYVFCFEVEEADKRLELKEFQLKLINEGYYWSECKDIGDLKSRIVLGLLHLVKETLDIKGESMLKQESETEKDGDTVSKEIELNHLKIDELLQQAKNTLGNEDDTIPERINKALELYRNVDRLATSSAYDKKKYSDFLFDYAGFLYKYGLYYDAEKVYLRQIPLAEEYYGTEHAKTTTSYNNIGLVYYAQGNYPQALKYYEKALAIREKVFGTEHSDTAVSYNNIGLVYYAQGDYPQALKYYEKALAIREKVLGTEHPDTAGSYNNIGLVYYVQGDYPQALKYYEKALAIREKILGTEHPDTAGSYNNIGLVYWKQSDYSKALEYYQKALDIEIIIFGTEHPDTAFSYNNIATIYRNQGKYNSALELFVKALVIREKVLGIEHPDTATSYYYVGMVYYVRGDYNKALDYYLKALKIREKVFGTEHPDIAKSYNSIGTVYNNMGDYSKALEYYQKALDIEIIIFGTEHPDTAFSYNNIGFVYWKQGGYSKALKYYQKALKIEKIIFGTEHHYTAFSYNDIGLVYWKQGDYSKAMKYFQKALDIVEKKFGTEHPYTASTYDKIGMVYSEKGDYDNALEYYRKTLSIRETALGTEHPDTISSYYNIGKVYWEQSDYNEAIKRFHEAFKFIENKQKQFDFEAYTVNLLKKSLQGYIEENNAKYIKDYYYSPEGEYPPSRTIFDLAVLNSEGKLLRVYETCTFAAFESNTKFIQYKLSQIKKITKAEVFLAFTVIENELMVLPLSKLEEINKKWNSERIETKTIKSFSEYYSLIKEICGNRVQDQQFFFRGQPDMQYEPLPSIYRNGRIEKESHLYHEAIRRNPKEFTEDMSTFDKLVKMQHYELPTRLLDITKNPLVALYFACKSDFEADGEVLVYSILRDMQIQYYDSDHVYILANLAKCPIDFDINKHKSYLAYDIKKEWPIFDDTTLTSDSIQDVLCVLPKLNNSRIIKQDGAFFIFGMGKDKQSPADFLDVPTTILVQANAKKDILYELDLLGINEASMFPETDKVMHQIREEFCDS